MPPFLSRLCIGLLALTLLVFESSAGTSDARGPDWPSATWTKDDGAHGAIGQLGLSVAQLSDMALSHQLGGAIRAVHGAENRLWAGIGNRVVLFQRDPAGVLIPIRASGPLGVVVGLVSVGPDSAYVALENRGANRESVGGVAELVAAGDSGLEVGGVLWLPAVVAAIGPLDLGQETNGFFVATRSPDNAIYTFRDPGLDPVRAKLSGMVTAAAAIGGDVFVIEESNPNGPHVSRVRGTSVLRLLQVEGVSSGDLVVDGSRLFFMGEQVIVDFSGAVPQVIETEYVLSGLTVYNNVLYAAGEGASGGYGLAAYNVSNPVSRTLAAITAEPLPVLPSAAWVVGDAIVTDSAGIEVLEPATTDSDEGVQALMSLATWRSIPWAADAVSVGGRLAAVGHSPTLWTYELSNDTPSGLPVEPAAQHVSWSSNLAHIAVSEHALVASEAASASGSLHVFDTREPNRIVYSGAVGGLPEISQLQAAGHTAIGLSAAGLELVDVADPNAPELLQTYPLRFTEDAGDLAVSGEVAYVVTGDAIYMLDLTNPREPEILSSVAFLAGTVTAEGTRLFVASREAIAELDFSNPRNPLLVATHSMDPGADLVLSNNRLYVAVGDRIRVFDVTRPGELRGLPSLVSGTAVNQLSMNQGILVAAGGSSGIYVFTPADLERISLPLLSARSRLP